MPDSSSPTDRAPASRVGVDLDGGSGRRIAAELALALIAGCVAYWLSCLFVPSLDVAIGFGLEWEKMSKDPFAFVGDLPHRILAPLLAHLLGFVGPPHYVQFVRGLSVVLLGTIFYFCRRRDAKVFDAALVTVAVALLAPVQMYKLHWVGYSDALTYALFFWALLAERRPVVFWSLFFANLLNHELAAFLLPWLWFVRCRAGGGSWCDVIGAAAAVGLYAAYYFYVKATAHQRYSVDFFVDYPLFPGGTFCVLVLACVQWTVAFGPVLAILAWFQHTRSNGREHWHLWLVLGGILAIFCIAWDWQRHTNLVVMPLVIASLRFLALRHRAAFLTVVGLGTVAMVFVPPWQTISWPTNLFAEPGFLLRVNILVPVPPNGVGFGTLNAAVGRWLPEVWPALWPILCILAAIWTAGALYARFTTTRAA